MSAKAIREATGKRLLNESLGDAAKPCRFASVEEGTVLDSLPTQHPWLLTEVFIQLITG